MARLRNVGRQAAAADDLISLKDLNAALQALPGQYIQVSRLNQPLGVPQLDNNARITNTYLPTDISRTTLTATGKVKGGQIEAVGTGVFGGGVTADSLSTTAGAVIGTTLTATGKISTSANFEAVGDVKGASFTGPLMAVPENTSPTFKAKAVTVDSLQLTTGGFNATTLSSTTGDITSAARVVATTAIVGGTDISAANDIVAGRDLVAIETVRGVGGVFSGDLGSATFHTSGLATLSDLDVVNALDVGGLTTHSGPTALTGGVQGPITKTGGGAVPINGGITSDGAINGTTITGSGLVKGVGLESTGTLKVAGAVTGVTTLAASDNITITGTGKKIISPDANFDTLLVTGQAHLGSLGIDANANGHYLVNGTFTRQNANRFEAFLTSQWAPNLASATYMVKAPSASGTAGQDIPNSVFTLINMPNKMSAAGTSSDALFQQVQSGSAWGIRVKVPGWYLVQGFATLTVLGGKLFASAFAVNGGMLTYTNQDMWNGGPWEQWKVITVRNNAMLYLAANDIVNYGVYQDSRFDAGGAFGSDIISEAGTAYVTNMSVTFMGFHG